MDILKIVLMIIFAIDCIALTVIVLMQEGKSAGLGAISGIADTYWGQNKGRSMEDERDTPVWECPFLEHRICRGA